MKEENNQRTLEAEAKELAEITKMNEEVKFKSRELIKQEQSGEHGAPPTPRISVEAFREQVSSLDHEFKKLDKRNRKLAKKNQKLEK